MTFSRHSSVAPYNAGMNTATTSSARRWLLRGLAATGLAAAGLTLADDSERKHDHDHDHERARRALEQGAALPLRSVLDRVEREFPGQVLKVEFEREDNGSDRFVYKIRVLQPDGRVVGLKLDAQDGRVLGIKRRGQGKEGDANPRH